MISEIPATQISLKEPAIPEVRLLSALCLCPKRGGQLFLVGKAGYEPCCRTK